MTVISGLPARIRGPAIRPLLMAFLAVTPKSGLAEAASKMLVKPWSSRRRQFLAVSSMCSSGGMTPSSEGAPMPVKEGWQWPSTRPGISVMPVPSMTVAPSTARRSPPLASLVIRSPVISTSAGKASALSPSKTVAFWMTMRPMTSSLTALWPVGLRAA